MTDTVEPVIGYHGSYKEITRSSPLRYERVSAASTSRSMSMMHGAMPTMAASRKAIFRLQPSDQEPVQNVRHCITRADDGSDSRTQGTGHDAVFGVSNSHRQVYEIAVFDPEQIEIVAVEKRLELEGTGLRP